MLLALFPKPCFNRSRYWLTHLSSSWLRVNLIDTPLFINYEHKYLSRTRSGTAMGANMSVNDTEVMRIINEAIHRVPVNPSDPCCGRVSGAFRNLQTQRQIPGNSLDLELAAAEHYMFARLMVCSGHVNQTQMRMLVDGYQIKNCGQTARRPQCRSGNIKSCAWRITNYDVSSAAYIDLILVSHLPYPAQSCRTC